MRSGFTTQTVPATIVDFSGVAPVVVDTEDLPVPAEQDDETTFDAAFDSAA